ncbi:MAG: hypothetical protein RSB71_02515 [Bacilli bacterium]
MDLNLYDILKIKDIKLKNIARDKYYTYILGISNPICKELKKRGLNFNYSRSINQLTIKQMADELKLFCELNKIDEQERHIIVGIKR